MGPRCVRFRFLKVLRVEAFEGLGCLGFAVLGLFRFRALEF